MESKHLISLMRKLRPKKDITCLKSHSEWSCQIWNPGPLTTGQNLVSSAALHSRTACFSTVGALERFVKLNETHQFSQKSVWLDWYYGYKVIWVGIIKLKSWNLG